MLPSMHPYVAKLSYGDKITIVNPDSDYFSLPDFGVEFLHKTHKPESYDIVHIHFSFDKVDIDNLRCVLQYFKHIRKPVVWTCHSKESQRIRNYCNGAYQRLLYECADKVITLTSGCKEWVEHSWGMHSKTIEVIPHGLIALPSDVKKNLEGVTKNRNRFTILYGEFRENKERINAIADFLKNRDMMDAELHLIYKNPTWFRDTDPIGWATFTDITNNSRCSKFVKSWITNDELIREFCSSHCIILPYLWGTHSGQIELAKDCGCYVVAPDVGFYKEQWPKTILWGDDCENKTYIDALRCAYSSPPLVPLGEERLQELTMIIDQHLSVYQSLCNN